MISGRRSRAVLSLAVVVGLALAALGWARWLSLDREPSPEGDLDVPVLFGREELRWEDLEDDADQGGVPVLCYHYFRPGLTAGRMVRVLGAVLLNMPTLPDRDFWTTTVPEFDRQMKFLSDEGYVSVSLRDLADWMDGRREIPAKSVVITIDDGDESFVEHAVPVLRRYGFRATLFLLTGRAGERDWNELDFVDWETLRRLEREGVLRVESHTHRMHTKVDVNGDPVPRFLLAARDSTGRLTENSRLVQDLRASRATIRRELGHDPEFLAWPFGFGDAAVDSVAHSLGFRRILTLRAERNHQDFEEEDLAHDDGLGRYAMTARTSFRIFRRMVERSTEVGHADPW